MLHLDVLKVDRVLHICVREAEGARAVPARGPMARASWAPCGHTKHRRIRWGHAGANEDVECWHARKQSTAVVRPDVRLGENNPLRRKT